MFEVFLKELDIPSESRRRRSWKKKMVEEKVTASEKEERKLEGDRQTDRNTERQRGDATVDKWS